MSPPSSEKSPAVFSIDSNVQGFLFDVHPRKLTAGTSFIHPIEKEKSSSKPPTWGVPAVHFPGCSSCESSLEAPPLASTPPRELGRCRLPKPLRCIISTPRKSSTATWSWKTCYWMPTTGAFWAPITTPRGGLWFVESWWGGGRNFMGSCRDSFFLVVLIWVKKTTATRWAPKSPVRWV